MLLSKFRFLLLFICFLFVISFTGCIVDKSPIENEAGIDPAIIGDWYHKTTGTIAGGISVEAIYGIRILEDGVILPLAIEISTGKLIELPERSPGTFLYAQNGKFSLRTNQLGMVPPTTYNSTYKVSTHELAVEMMTENGYIHILHEKYIKSRVGNKVTEPVQTNLEMMMGGTLYSNAQIASIPSAYAGLFINENDTPLIINSISQNYQVIVFNLKNFHGAGIYQLGSETSGRASIYSIRGDVIGIVSTDQHPQAGYITVDDFDVVAKVCSGTFEFEIEPFTYSDGVFSVPIYE